RGELFPVALHERMVARDDDARRSHWNVGGRTARPGRNYAYQFHRSEMASAGQLLGRASAATHYLRATSDLDRAAGYRADGCRFQTNQERGACRYSDED